MMKNINLKQEFGAVDKVKKHLCFEFGEALNLSLSSNFFYTSFVLPLEFYTDYKEALKVQENLTYVLGQNLLKCLKLHSKNPFKILAHGGGREVEFSFLQAT